MAKHARGRWWTFDTGRDYSKHDELAGALRITDLSRTEMTLDHVKGIAQTAVNRAAAAGGVPVRPVP